MCIRDSVNTGRLGAQGLYNVCTPVSKANAQPGDLIFFVGTYDTCLLYTSPIARTISMLKFSRKSKNRRNCSLNNSTAKAKPKMTVKNGVIYGDALSAQEKKRIVMQKKKDRKAKKVRKSCLLYTSRCV